VGVSPSQSAYMQVWVDGWGFGISEERRGDTETPEGGSRGGLQLIVLSGCGKQLEVIPLKQSEVQEQEGAGKCSRQQQLCMFGFMMKYKCA
jgi:hypothetical protein